jgi:4-amino-4-deoxy-L-arabinose transferase-like glycosyltransferase
MKLSFIRHGRIIHAAGQDESHGLCARQWLIPALGIAFLGLGLKAALLAAGAFPFNADEAIVGLMARHILRGQWPIFFYGQAYMGSLDAVLVALAFALFGEGVLAIRLVQVALYLGTILTTGLLARRIFGSHQIAIGAALLVAIPSVNATLYTTVSLGGYGEALLIGNLLLLISLGIVENPEPLWPYLLFGLLGGLGVWAFGLVLVYLLPAGALLVGVAWREGTAKARLARLLLLLTGLLVGALPILLWAISKGGEAVVSELFGAAIAGVSSGSGASLLWQRLVNLILFGSTVVTGLRPPWDVRWLALPLAPLALGFWLAALAYAFLVLRRRNKGRTGRWLLMAVVAVLLLGYLVTPFGVDPSGRYFLPLIVPMAILGAEMLFSALQKRWLAWFVLGVVLLFNLWGTMQCALRNPPGITTQFDAVARIDHAYDGELIDFLEEHGERRGYTNYWVAYPLAFQSQEQLIFVPRLPYHLDMRYTPRDDRYAPYDEAVASSERVAYITSNHPLLDAKLREAFAQAGVQWREEAIGDYHVFFALSLPIRVGEVEYIWGNW